MATKKSAQKAPPIALVEEVAKTGKAASSEPKERQQKAAVKSKGKKASKTDALPGVSKVAEPVNAKKPGKREKHGKTSKPAKEAKPSKTKPSPSPGAAPVLKPTAKAKSPSKTKSLKKADPFGAHTGSAKLLDSQVVYEGPLFRVLRDRIIEPGGQESTRDVIRHNGSVVILGVEPSKDKKDPWILIERQYRHAAGQYLWELPAGKLDAGEQPVAGAKRELAEETGYSAKKWSPLVEYFASPGFLGESMKVFLAEGLVAGEAHPEEDERIDFHLVRLSELLAMADQGKIVDGKTLTSVLLYARKLGLKRKK